MFTFCPSDQSGPLGYFVFNTFFSSISSEGVNKTHASTHYSIISSVFVSLPSYPYQHLLLLYYSQVLEITDSHPPLISPIIMLTVPHLNLIPISSHLIHPRHNPINNSILDHPALLTCHDLTSIPQQTSPQDTSNIPSHPTFFNIQSNNPTQPNPIRGPLLFFISLFRESTPPSTGSPNPLLNSLQSST